MCNEMMEDAANANANLFDVIFIYTFWLIGWWSVIDGNSRSVVVEFAYRRSGDLISGSHLILGQFRLFLIVNWNIEIFLEVVFFSHIASVLIHDGANLYLLCPTVREQYHIIRVSNFLQSYRGFAQLYVFLLQHWFTQRSSTAEGSFWTLEILT